MLPLVPPLELPVLPVALPVPVLEPIPVVPVVLVPALEDVLPLPCVPEFVELVVDALEVDVVEPEVLVDDAPELKPVEVEPGPVVEVPPVVLVAAEVELAVDDEPAVLLLLHPTAHTTTKIPSAQREVMVSSCR